MSEFIDFIRSSSLKYTYGKEEEEIENIALKYSNKDDIKKLFDNKEANKEEYQVAYSLMIEGWVSKLMESKQNIILPDFIESPEKIKIKIINLHKNGVLLNDEIIKLGGLLLASTILHNANYDEIITYYERYFFYKGINELDSLINRAVSLREVFVKKILSDKLLNYSKEACLTYIYGFHNASVILLRTILEQALKEKYNIDVGTLGKLNQELYDKGLISREIYDKINKVNRKASMAVHNLTHGKNISERDNKFLIETTQKILKLLFV
jgi:hypothetical protein